MNVLTERSKGVWSNLIVGWNSSSQPGESTAGNICLYLETFLVITAAGGGREYQHLEGAKDASIIVQGTGQSPAMKRHQMEGQ